MGYDNYCCHWNVNFKFVRGFHKLKQLRQVLEGSLVFTVPTILYTKDNIKYTLTKYYIHARFIPISVRNFFLRLYIFKPDKHQKSLRRHFCNYKHRTICIRVFLSKIVLSQPACLIVIAAK